MTESTSKLQELLAIMRALRDPRHGCPWDLEQDFASIAPHTLEEVYEVIDAIEQQDYSQLRDELGDLLFQVVFYAQLGQEQGRFDFEAIAEGISNKLLQRHPHVFPAATLASAGQQQDINSEQVASNWEQIKQQEREARSAGAASLLDDVPLALPGLLRAVKLQKRAARAGFDWPDVAGVRAKLDEELAELDEALAAQDATAIEEEFGDLLFTMANLARHLGLNGETALRAANGKFEKRFRSMEKLAGEDGRELATLSENELDRYWQRAKQTNG